jgi:membrane-associated protease RseP (regulator of RpoE activity)
VEILLYILGVLIIAVGIVLSIGLHEIGHLVPAKRFGVHVGQYMIGFGRTLWSRKFGETEYGVKAIPLGGYISMAGMFPPAKAGGKARNSSTGFMETMMQDARTSSADTVKPGDENRVFYKLAIWKRIIIMLGGPTMNLVIGIALYAVVLCGFGVAQASTTIGSVSACVIAVSSEKQTCDPGDPKAPAAAADIRPGDRLDTINGTTITSWNQATALIRKSASDELTIVVEREGSKVTLSATPLLNERNVYAADGSIEKDASGNPVTEKVGFLGIGAANETVQQPLTAVLPAVGDNVVRVGGIILNLPQRLVAVANAAFGPGERDPNGPISVVGVGRIAGEIASIDTAPVASRAAALISLLASLNIALFVFNLIPLMPLDGGHVAGALWEGIRRLFARLFKRPDPGPVDIAKLLPLTMAVTIVLSAMSVLLIYADIVKPITLQ